MPDCDYCGETVDGEDAYLDHLAAEHEGELGSIDRRRVEDRTPGSDDGFPLGPAVLVGLLVFSGVLVVWVTFFMGSGGAEGQSPGAGSGPAFENSVSQPSNVGGAHTHGGITVTIDGQELDFSRQEYQLQDDAFHFENGDGSTYHVHAEGVTLEYALETLDIGVTESTLSFDGTTYDANDGDTVVYEVNGEEVDPGSYTLSEGDEVRVVAESG
ncbi:DUF3105 domain-containing protein [Halosimplex salinum]|uniref:DUF3105 domain-containing protein n=1 Tax=Halosimplex salinum TaxID=1710538 RepID=UPI0019D13DF4|nr:DUF3105 domain-containing protein [Halosimplex salinum]